MVLYIWDIYIYIYNILYNTYIYIYIYIYILYILYIYMSRAFRISVDLPIHSGTHRGTAAPRQAPVIYAAREGFGAACRVLVQYQAGDHAVVKGLWLDVERLGGRA